MIYFSCEEVGDIAARCQNKQNKDENNYNKYKGNKDFKSYKDQKGKGNKYCYMAKDFDSDDEDKIFYIDIKNALDDEEDERYGSHFLC